MKIFLRKTLGTLYPADEEAEEYINKLKNDSVISVEAKKPRNYRFLKKYKALLKIVFDNQDVFNNIIELEDRIKIEVGCVEIIKGWHGEINYKPGSISFAKMEEEEFSKFYSRVLDCVLANILTGSTPQEIENEILSFT